MYKARSIKLLKLPTMEYLITSLVEGCRLTTDSCLIRSAILLYKILKYRLNIIIADLH